MESFIEERAAAIEIQLVNFTPDEVTPIMTQDLNSKLTASYSNGILNINATQNSDALSVSVYKNKSKKSIIKLNNI